MDVVQLGGAVDAGQRLERAGGAVLAGVGDGHAPGAGRGRRGPVSGEGLAAGEAELLVALALAELQRQHAHAHQVAAVDALERLGDDRAHAQQQRALGRPVAAGAVAVERAGQHHQRRARLLVGHRGVVDARDLAGGQVLGPVALLAAGELVAQADVAEGAAHHHLVVAAPRAVAVEVALLHAVLDQVPARGRAHRDDAGRRDVVGGDRVAEHGQRARADDVGDRRRLRRDAAEEGRQLDVGGLGVPGVGLALGDRQGAPALVALEHGGVALLEDLRSTALADRLGDLLLGRPDVGQVDRRRRCPRRAARWSGRCRPGRPGRRPRPAAARPGSWRAPAGGCGPRSCGCRRAPRRPPGRSPRWPRRSARRAGRSCRCRWCSRSPPGRSAGRRGTGSGRRRSR